MKTKDIPTWWGRFWWVYEGCRLGGVGKLGSIYAAAYNATFY